MQAYKLNNGLEIPKIGFGTWRIKGGEKAVEIISTAIENGYRHFDTAAFYGNEKSVGEAIRNSGISREEFFITSKIWNDDRGYDKALNAFDKILSNLQLDYLDLCLIHWPASPNRYNNWKEINAETWNALEELKKAGKIKSIGISNFMKHHLEALLESVEIEPAVNQIEFHPGFMQQECVDFSKQNGIVLEAWAPLGAGAMLENPVLNEIASKYNKSVAQLCIRWVLQHDILPLVKSENSERMRSNLDVFDFDISTSDMQKINELEYFAGSGQDPDKIEF